MPTLLTRPLPSLFPQVLSRELLTHLDKQIQYTVDCRPQSMAMGNAIKWLKMRVGSRAVDQLSSAKAREMLGGQIDTFIEERVTLADKAILSYAESRIAPHDVILIYGGSQVIETVLLHAHAQVSPRRLNRKVSSLNRKVPTPR